MIKSQFHIEAPIREVTSSNKMAGVDKNLLGLLNGIAKREYYGEEGITDNFLREELYEEMDETNFEAHLKRFENLMKIMVNSDMDFRQLEAFLTSQMKRREGALTEEQVDQLISLFS